MVGVSMLCVYLRHAAMGAVFGLKKESIMIDVKMKLLPNARVPEYQSEHAAGADLYAALDGAMTVCPGERVLVPTGIYIEIPRGYEAQIRPRSGLALKHGILLPNSPGTIDADYRGEVKIIVGNMGKEPFLIEPGMRIAQMVFTRVYQGRFEVVDVLKETKRNEGGFGHTGI